MDKIAKYKIPFVSISLILGICIGYTLTGKTLLPSPNTPTLWGVTRNTVTHTDIKHLFTNIITIILVIAIMERDTGSLKFWVIVVQVTIINLLAKILGRDSSLGISSILLGVMTWYVLHNKEISSGIGIVSGVILYFLYKMA
jgi:membrane associated rhomboid family serine protease